MIKGVSGHAKVCRSTIALDNKKPVRLGQTGVCLGKDRFLVVHPDVDLIQILCVFRLALIFFCMMYVVNLQMFHVKHFLFNVRILKTVSPTAANCPYCVCRNR